MNQKYLKYIILLALLLFVGSTSFAQSTINSVYDLRKMLVDTYKEKGYTFYGYVDHTAELEKLETHEIEFGSRKLVLFAVIAKSKCYPMYKVKEQGSIVMTSDHKDNGITRDLSFSAVAGGEIIVDGPSHISIVFGPESGCDQWYGSYYELLVFYK